MQNIVCFEKRVIIANMNQSLIHPLQLGNKLFPINIIQGPLAGISCAPFRELIWRYSQPAFSCTEMLSVKTLIYQSKMLQKRFLEKDPREGPVCFQIAGNNPIEVAEAVKHLNEAGADLIDLNCGCPVNKIRRKGAGSSLLSQASVLYQLMMAMRQNTNLPISIKIRVDGDSTDQFNKEIAKVVIDAGIDFLIVHGRHWTEHYETACHYDHIQFFVEELKIPVIGNGDIFCMDSLMKMLATGCAGVMISRAAVGQPWLIRQLIAKLQNKCFIKPSIIEIGSIFIEHIKKLSLLLSNERFAVYQARKFSKYYAKDLMNKLEFCEAINQCDSMDAFERTCLNYFSYS